MKAIIRRLTRKIGRKPYTIRRRLVHGFLCVIMGVGVISSYLLSKKDLTPHSQAEFSVNYDQNTWLTDDMVYDSQRAVDGTVYLGGRFNYVGPYSGLGVQISAAGTVATTLPKIDGMNASVQAAVSDGSGGWYVGGEFTTVGGVAHSRLAHILSNGTLDSWAPNPDQQIKTWCSAEVFYM
jgi:hypothetical protein